MKPVIYVIAILALISIVYADLGTIFPIINPFASPPHLQYITDTNQSGLVWIFSNFSSDCVTLNGTQICDWSGVNSSVTDTDTVWPINETTFTNNSGTLTIDNSWFNDIFVRFSNIVAAVGNWTLDQSKYYNSSQVDSYIETNVSAANDSVVAYVDAQDHTKIDFLYDSGDTIENNQTVADNLNISGRIVAGNATIKNEAIIGDPDSATGLEIRGNHTGNATLNFFTDMLFLNGTGFVRLPALQLTEFGACPTALQTHANGTAYCGSLNSSQDMIDAVMPGVLTNISAANASAVAYSDSLDHADHGDGANCAAGEYPLGVDADGAVQSCTDATTEINTVAATQDECSEITGCVENAITTVNGTPLNITSLTIPSLISCDTINTTEDGTLECGNDASGGDPDLSNYPNKTDQEDIGGLKNFTDGVVLQKEYTAQSGIQHNIYDDGSDGFWNLSTFGEFTLETDNSRVTLYDTPSAANNWHIFEIFSKEGTFETGFSIHKAGAGRAAHFPRSLMVTNQGHNCTLTTEMVDCDTDGSGNDFIVLDDGWFGGRVIIANGSLNTTDGGDLISIGSVNASAFYDDGVLLADTTIANETVRVDNIGSFNCSGTDKVTGRFINGTAICGADSSGSFTNGSDIEVGSLNLTKNMTIELNRQILALENSDGAPPYSFIDSPDMGINRGGSTVMYLIAGGSHKAAVSTTYLGFSVAGSESAPGFIHSTDLNTGLYRPVADTLCFSSGGVTMWCGEEGTADNFTINQESYDLDFIVESDGEDDALVVDGGTNHVGINTSTPTHALNVNGNANITGWVFGRHNDSCGFMRFGLNGGTFLSCEP